jgi:hypothetical protein
LPSRYWCQRRAGGAAQRGTASWRVRAKKLRGRRPYSGPACRAFKLVELRGSNLRGRRSAALRRRRSSSPPTPAILTPRDTRNHESPAEDPRILNPRRSLRHLRQTGRITWSIAGLEKDTGPALAAARWARTSRRTSCQAPPGRPRLVLAASCTGETPRPHQSTGTRARRWPESARAFRH